MMRVYAALRPERASNTSSCPLRLAAISAIAASSFSLVACGGDMQPDVVADRVVRDSSTEMDSGVSPRPDVLSQPDVASMPDTPTSMDATNSNSCCRAFSPANQGQCDALDAAGPSVCNLFNDGTVCAWSLEARCNDSGVPVDAGPPPNCCLAIEAANAAFCSALSSFGSDRCNRANGGGVCVWSGAAVCNPAPPMDSGVALDSSTDARTDALADVRTDALLDVRDSGPADSGVRGCCLARNGTISNLAYCRAQTTMASCTDAMGLARTCVWSATPLCASPLGSNGACCIPRFNMMFQATCAPLATSGNCIRNANCQWRCP